jgi:hypothetical protein
METQESVKNVVHPVQSTVENHQALFSHDPERAYKEAQRLVSVVANRCTGPGYLVNIKGKQYPKIEWWTSVSASLGLFPRVLYSKRLERDGEIAYEAKVEVHRNGLIIASGEALCSSNEARWQHADEYAIKSMAITRASGKAYRIPLSFLAVMAGLEVTPAEEMPSEASHNTYPDEVRADNRKRMSPSEKQISAIRILLDQRDSLVFPVEKRQIHSLLENTEQLTRDKCSEILDFYHGISVRSEDGVWTKTSNRGKLEERR